MESADTVSGVRPGRHWYLIVALVVAAAFVVTMAVLSATNSDEPMDDMPGMDMGLGAHDRA